LTDYWDVTAQMSYLQMDVGYDLVIFPPGTSGPGQFPDGKILRLLYGERHSRFDISGFYSRFNKHLIRVGTGYIVDDQYDIHTLHNFAGGAIQNFTDTPDAGAPEINRDDMYIFLQDTWKLSQEWELTSGIRYDKYSDFGKTINPRLALVWQPLPAFTSKLLFGSAFRAPTFDELYINNDVTMMGNPNLKPETIETWELALSYVATETLHFSFNLFSFDIEDKILYPNAPQGSNVMFMAQNAGNWEGYGLEFETRWKMTNKSNLWFNYAFQNSEDQDIEQELGNSPTHQAYLRTDWLVFPNWFLNGQLNWQADWSRQPNDPRDKIDASVTMNLNLRYKNINQNRWSFAVGVRNLFDEDVKNRSIGPDSNGRISMPNDYPLDRRSYWLEMKYRF
jgi:iron complex outermembrane receptor protein